MLLLNSILRACILLPTHALSMWILRYLWFKTCSFLALSHLDKQHCLAMLKKLDSSQWRSRSEAQRFPDYVDISCSGRFSSGMPCRVPGWTPFNHLVRLKELLNSPHQLTLAAIRWQTHHLIVFDYKSLHGPLLFMKGRSANFECSSAFD